MAAWRQEVICRGGHEQHFFESAIAIPQLVGSTSAIAILQLKKNVAPQRNSAIPQSQFFLTSATSSPQLESLLSQFLAYFWLWNPVDS
jgi:hypothetical protein